LSLKERTLLIAQKHFVSYSTQHCIISVNVPDQ
jgi:hypothetical protein